MEELTDNIYCNYPVHDMGVDYDYYIITTELSDIFNDENLDEYINNLND